MERSTAWWLIVPALFAVLWLAMRWLISRRGEPSLRALAGYEMIHDSVAAGAEEGRPVHLSLGTGGIGDASALETAAALTALDFLAREAAPTRNTPVVTTGNAATLIAAQEIMGKPFAARDALAQFDPLAVRFAGGGASDSGAATMAGVIDLLERREASANFLLGRFGDEVLLAGEAGARAGVRQVAGAANPNALPFMALFADHLLMGEELYAAGAYLSRLTSHVAALAAQDVARWLLIGAVLALAAARTLGML